MRGELGPHVLELLAFEEALAHVSDREYRHLEREARRTGETIEAVVLRCLEECVRRDEELWATAENDAEREAIRRVWREEALRFKRMHPLDPLDEAKPVH